ncbi:hypothetical protein FSP39_016035 [Pinctada imbricata]|uniref:Alpha/beta hydrolase fold-3 domain-containing protein n=1 Tax=Pinctada imbricata TaxID=66713 RepID=A0AA89BPW2_PINIB|nr:hypothetical protein FSP39_016035 [Pinctada imbricata]
MERNKSTGYSVVKDIPYNEGPILYELCVTSKQTYLTPKKDESFDRKHTVDLYLPEAKLGADSEPSPLVLFVHGGGWRRGDKDGWRHFISDDINLLVAFIHWVQGLYGNVGEAFARRGIPCAVMSYPLAKLKSPWILLELVTSYLCSTLFLRGLLASMALLLSIVNLLTPFSLYNYIVTLSRIRYLFGSSASSMLTYHLSFTNTVILCVIGVQYRHYRLNKLSSTSILLFSSSLFFVLSSIIFRQHALSTYFWISLLISQGILLVTNLLSNQVSPLDQVTALQRCLARLQSMGEGSRLYDPQAVFLMGHSAGGHLCSLAALNLGQNERYNIKPCHIKGVIAVSAVLQVENMNYNPVNRLYLHPSFGSDPESWQSVCPLNHLKSKANNREVPHFLVVSAQYDFHLTRDAASFSRHLEELHDVDADHVVIPRTNHTSIICNIDKCRNSCHPSLLDVCIRYIGKQMSGT